MTRRLLVLVTLGWLLAAGITVATPADATSAVVSVAQSIAMGQPPHRLGDTRSLLAGRWPHAIPGATPDDVFIIATSSSHMVARINGVGIEARQSGERFRIGPDAASPWDRQFTRVYHIDPKVLV